MPGPQPGTYDGTTMGSGTPGDLGPVAAAYTADDGSPMGVAAAMGGVPPTFPEGLGTGGFDPSAEPVPSTEPVAGPQAWPQNRLDEYAEGIRQLNAEEADPGLADTGEQVAANAADTATNTAADSVVNTGVDAAAEAVPETLRSAGAAAEGAGTAAETGGVLDAIGGGLESVIPPLIDNFVPPELQSPEQRTHTT